MRDSVGLRDVTVQYVLAGPGFVKTEVVLPMVGSNGTFVASIPGQTNGSLIRFRIHAVNQRGASRFFPAENEPQPAISCWVQTGLAPGNIPLGFFINTDAEEMQTFAKQRRNDAGAIGPFSSENRNRIMTRQRIRNTQSTICRKSSVPSNLKSVARSDRYWNNLPR